MRRAGEKRDGMGASEGEERRGGEEKRGERKRKRKLGAGERGRVIFIYRRGRSSTQDPMIQQN